MQKCWKFTAWLVRYIFYQLTGGSVLIDSKVLACGSNKKLSKHKTIPHASLIIIKIWRLLSNLRLTLFYFCMHRFGFFCCSYCDKMGQKRERHETPAAVHTWQRCRTCSKVQQPGRRSQDIKEQRGTACFLKTESPDSVCSFYLGLTVWVRLLW